MSDTVELDSFKPDCGRSNEFSFDDVNEIGDDEMPWQLVLYELIIAVARYALKI